jgi:peptidyl-dipeptidase Dcp
MNMLGLLSTLAAVGIAASPGAGQDSPLLQPWSGPHGGVPPFDKVKVEDFRSALEKGMAQQMAEIDRIAADPAAPTFDNTLAALERAGQPLDRVTTLYSIWSSTMSGPEFQAVEREMAPKLAAFSDRITQNEKLFARIAAVYEARDKASLTAEQKRLAWLYHTNFVRAGARLDAPAKKRLSEINQRLAGLFTRFSQSVLADETDHLLVLESQADLAGLPDSVVSGAAAAAESRGQKGKWAILNTRSSVEPFLTYSERRDLREKVFRTFTSRGDNGDQNDTNAIVTEVLALRAERAKLLGYATHAHWRLENAMARPRSEPSSSWKRCGPPRSRGCARKWRTCRPSPTARRPGSGSSPGTTASTRRRCARTSTTWTRTRSSRTSSSTSCERACSPWRPACSGSTSRRSPGCPSTTRTSRRTR